MAIGVFLADLLLLVIGTGAWQVTVLVALAMSVTLLLNAGTLFVTQAAVQGIVVVTFAAAPGYALTRWVDALIGGSVALVAAAVVPRAPLRRPREQAAVVVRRIAELLAAGAEHRPDGDVERGLQVLADARNTERLIRELQDAADEGLSVIASSPFRRRHSGRRAPDGRARRAARPGDAQHPGAGAADRGVELPPRADPGALQPAVRGPRGRRPARWPTSWRPASGPRVRESLLRIGAGTAQVERVADLSADVVLAQISSIIVDLLQITGMDVLEATDALPPPQL